MFAGSSPGPVATGGPLMRLTWKPGGKAYLRNGYPSQYLPQQQRSLVVLTALVLRSPCIPVFLQLFPSVP